MKHILILDDKSRQNQALLEIARALNGVKVLTPAQWEAMEDKYAASEIKKGLKTPVASAEDVKKALQKMRA